MTKPHAAVVQALATYEKSTGYMVLKASTLLIQVSREYEPLVEAARDLVYKADSVVNRARLRAALKEVCGE